MLLKLAPGFELSQASSFNPLFWHDAACLMDWNRCWLRHQGNFCALVLRLGVEVKLTESALRRSRLPARLLSAGATDHSRACCAVPSLPGPSVCQWCCSLRTDSHPKSRMRIVRGKEVHLPPKSSALLNLFILPWSGLVNATVKSGDLILRAFLKM